MMQFRTIRARLTLWYVLLLALILMLFSAVLYLILDRSLDRSVDNELRLSAEQALGDVMQQNGQLVVQTTGAEVDFEPLSERGTFVRIANIDGQIIQSIGPFSTLRAPLGTLAAARQGHSRFDDLNAPGDNTPIRLYTLPYIENGQVYGFVEVGRSLKSLQDTLHQLLLIMALVMPTTLVLASIGGLFLADKALSPIDRITRAAQRISAEDLKQRLHLALPNDEVGRLARTFDGMLERLEEAFGRQRQFTEDASHELRTPLAIMKGDIGVALNRPRSPAQYQLVLSDMEEEVDRLTRLVDDLLLLARADSDHPLLHAESLDLTDLIQLVIDQMRPLAQAKKQNLNLQLPPALCFNGDPDKLIRLFLNLVDNAVKYTPPSGQITIKITDEGQQGQQWITVAVIDSGPGIAPEELAHVFDRFYRADSSRSRTSGGYGLGLSVARSITEAHGGHIDVQSKQGEGSNFTVFLPRSDCLGASHFEAIS